MGGSIVASPPRPKPSWPPVRVELEILGSHRNVDSRAPTRSSSMDGRDGNRSVSAWGLLAIAFDTGIERGL